MNKRIVRRLLETFFRRWYLYLLPLVLFMAAGAYSGLQSSSGFRSVGVVDVSRDTLLSQLTAVRGEQFGYETPAASTARTMNSLLRTDHFIESVAEEAGVSDVIESGGLTTFGLRQSIFASPDDDSLLSVVAITDNPELSARLVSATIKGFIDYVVAGNISESRAAEEFFENQLEIYDQAVIDAQVALTQYAAAHPGGPLDERPLAEQLEIQRLTSVVTQAQDKSAAAQQKSEEARLATEQSTSDISQRLRVIDEPQIASAPEPRLKDAAFSFGIYTFVGLLISVGAVVLAAFSDRSLRSAEDVEHLVGLPVMAVIPEIRRSKRSHRPRKTPKTSSSTSPARTRSTGNGPATPASANGKRTSIDVDGADRPGSSRSPARRGGSTTRTSAGSRDDARQGSDDNRSGSRHTGPVR